MRVNKVRQCQVLIFSKATIQWPSCTQQHCACISCMIRPCTCSSWKCGKQKTRSESVGHGAEHWTHTHTQTDRHTHTHIYMWMIYLRNVMYMYKHSQHMDIYIHATMSTYVPSIQNHGWNGWWKNTCFHCKCKWKCCFGRFWGWVNIYIYSI